MQVYTKVLVPHENFKATSSTTCEVALDDHTFTGALQLEGTTRWSDGDVWRREDEAP